MGYRTIYLHDIEVKFKKGKSMLTKRTQVVSVATTPMEMNKTSRLMSQIRGEMFGIKTKAYSTPNNIWVTKIISSKPISKSFYYT